MRIRKKTAKPDRTRPLYLIGHAGTLPSIGELRFWFDREYGGPLRADAEELTSTPVLFTHGPWAATVERLTEALAEHWKEGLGWSHPAALHVGAAGGAADRIDQTLHVARLARGLTLLTQGTAYDLFAQAYLNPSDWQDRPLERFIVSDHVQVQQGEGPDTEQDTELEWFYSRGLPKFGLDELETFRPVGLSSTPVHEALTAIAEALIRLGRMPKVGETLSLTDAGLSVSVRRHRTVDLGGLTVPLREIAWSPLTSLG